MYSKIKEWWSGLADKVNQYDSKYFVIRFLAKRLSWMMVNTFYFLNVTAVIGLLFFIVSTLVGESNTTILFKTSGEGLLGFIFGKDIDAWETLFFGGLLGFAPWVIYGIAGILYVWIIRPIIQLIKKD